MKNVKIYQIAVVSILVFLLSLTFISLSDMRTVKASNGNWLSGWNYRKSHVINPAFGAGTNYQVRIKTFYFGNETEPEVIIPISQLVSTLPVPSGASIMSAQAAVYWDGTYLHVWYGAQSTPGNPSTDDIYYTKTSSPFTSWNTPVKVIDRPSGNGIRDPTIFVEGDYIYLFCQCYESGAYRPIRLYKVAKTADFTNPNNYVHIGVVLDIGISGEFDDLWVASPCVVKIGSTYWMAYEAKSSSSVYSLGRAYSTNIESLPWTKDGQMRDANGNVIYNPYGQTYDFAPDTFPDTDTLFVHLRDAAGTYYVRYMNGDVPNNSMILNSTSCQPADGYSSHCNFAHIGLINGLYMFLMQSWDANVYLRLYRQVAAQDSGDTVFLNRHCRTDFGDIRFTKSDGVTELNYWMEEKVDGNYAIFWVEVADDLSTNPATIYIYYGNPTATTTSNGENTFLFFDDFQGSTYDPDKWQVVGSPTITVSNGELKIQRDSYSGSWSVHGLRSKTFQADEKRIIAKAKTNTFSRSCNVRIDVDYYSVGQTNKAMFESTSRRIYLECDRRDAGGGIADIIMTSGASANTYYTIYITRWSSSYFKGWLNGEYKGQVTNYVNDGSTYIGLFVEEWNSHETIVGTYDWIAVAKYVDLEPSHGLWESEETFSDYVIIDKTFVSDERADVGSIQTVGFHAKWNNNGSDIVQGSIYVNGTEYITNNTGWISFTVTSPRVGKQEWVITAVNCDGITSYTQTAPNPSIIWDQIQITNGGTTKESAILGETSTIWFQTEYQYDHTIFDDANGILYMNGSQMFWSTINNRWEYQYTPTTPGTKTFTISAVQDNSYGLTIINDLAGIQTINVWSTPFSIISNSTITELAFDSTTKTITFTVTGPTGTTGYTNITIAKTLIENITDLAIYLDGNQIEYAATSTEYAWLIHFTYTHSTHKVTILLNALNTTSPLTHQITTALPLSGILIAMAISLLAGKKSQQKKRNKT